jgi:mRNA interferase MazF
VEFYLNYRSTLSIFLYNSLIKDFDKWNKEKKEIDSNNGYLPLYRKRQIRWCRLGINIGFEQDGTGKEFSRPVLILKAFSRNVCLVAPLTTTLKRNKYLMPLGIVGNRTSQVIISQIRLIDTRRLDQHITTIHKVKFEEIRKAVKALL